MATQVTAPLAGSVMQQTPRHGLGRQELFSTNTPTVVGQLAAVAGETQTPVSRMQQEPVCAQTTPVQVLPAPYQGLVPHEDWVVMTQPAAAVQQAPLGLQVTVVQPVLAYQVPLQLACVVWTQPAALQHAPVWTQGLAVVLEAQEMPGYQVSPDGHWACGVFTHEPLTGSQQAPVVVVFGQGFGWQALDPPPR
jgi:hypothetical protein